MPRPLATAAAVTLAVGLLAATGASASGVAWSVSIGAPGVAVNVGAPGHWGHGYPVYRGAGWVRPWVRPAVAAPLWLPPPYPVAAYPIARYPLSAYPVAAYPPVRHAVRYAVPYAAPYAAGYAPGYPVVVPRALPVPVRAHRRAVVPAPVLLAPPHGHPRY